MQLVLFIGIPGSGKSTFYKKYFFHSHLRVNLDMLKTRNKEEELLKYCFKYYQKAVVDNTNVSEPEREKYIKSAKENKFTVIGYYFKSEPKEAVIRNNLRTGKERVPEKAVFIKYKQLEKPKLSEGFNELYEVETLPGGEFLVEEIKEG